MSNKKINRLKLVTVAGFLLLLVGVSIYGYSHFMIQNLEQLLSSSDLTPEEFWDYEGSVNWWIVSSNVFFFPLAAVFVILGVIFLFSAVLMIMQQKNNLPEMIVSKGSVKRAESVHAALDEIILTTVVTKKPETIEQLVNLVHQETGIFYKTILEHVLSQQQAGKIKFEIPSITATKAPSFIVSGGAKWYLATLIIAGLSVFCIFQIPENNYPLVYARYILGSFFVLLLPGHSLVRALYLGKEIDNIERLGLSIVLSIALAGVVSFFLNFSPWGILFSPIALILFVLVILFATIGVIREFWLFRKTNK